MKYTPKFFKETMPEWKRQKDPPLSRLFYRRAGFALAAVFANAGISANTVSYISLVVGILGCALYLPRACACHIVGAALINLWLVLDCTDGCIARSVKGEPFGEFADSSSSYTLVGLMGAAMGVAAYFEGGALIPAGTPWIILAGALASSADTLMRLIYQKYKNVERDMADKGIVEVEWDKRTDHSQVNSLRVRVEQDLGIGGILPLLILLATIFRALDLAILYCLAYYGLSCVLVYITYIRKAVRAARAHTGAGSGEKHA